MNSSLRIGYAPYDSSLTLPGDRRRFCHYAKVRGLSFEQASPDRSYDLLVITAGADLSVWSRYEKKGDAKIIFELIDSYFSVSSKELRSILRGTAKFVTRQNQFLMLNYTEALRQICKKADAVICTTEEQRADIQAHCDSVHIILDFHDDDILGEPKSDFSAGRVFNFVWEGFANNLQTFSVISEVLESIKRDRPISIHAITDVEFGRALKGKWFRTSTLSYARKILPDFRIYQWDHATFASIARSCDLALIPIPLNQPLYRGKPENKLTLFWKLGLPVLASDTPAYARALSACGLDEMLCRTEQDWIGALSKYMNDEEARRSAALRGRSFAIKHYSESRIMAQWDSVLQSI